MNKVLNPDEIRQLGVTDRLRLIEDVWNTLTELPEQVEIPAWHRAELDARLATHESDPSTARPWAESKAGILDALRK